jgi:hypothetical protein
MLFKTRMKLARAYLAKGDFSALFPMVDHLLAAGAFACHVLESETIALQIAVSAGPAPADGSGGPSSLNAAASKSAS